MCRGEPDIRPSSKVDWLQIAKMTYMAYDRAINCTSRQGDATLMFEQLPSDVQRAWVAASRTACLSLQLVS